MSQAAHPGARVSQSNNLTRNSNLNGVQTAAPLPGRFGTASIRTSYNVNCQLNPAAQLSTGGDKREPLTNYSFSPLVLDHHCSTPSRTCQLQATVRASLGPRNPLKTPLNAQHNAGTRFVMEPIVLKAIGSKRLRS